MGTRLRSRACVILLGVILMAGVRVARAADEQPLDTIVLHDGALVRGRVVELVPRERVVIQLATGETRTIDWALVARTEGPSFAPAPAPAPSAPAPSVVLTDPLLTPGPGRVPLLVESTGRPIRVGEPTGSGSGWSHNTVVSVAFGRTVCSTPCTLQVSPGSVPLWLQGEGQRTQLLYATVPSEGGAVRVRPSSMWGSWGGWALLGAGVAFVGGGATMLSLGINQRDYVDGAYVTRNHNDLIVPGAVFVAASIPALVGGIILIYKNRGGIESQRSLAQHASR